MAKKNPSMRFFKPSKKTTQQTTWQTASLTIDSVSVEGRGIARHQGKVVFVSGALAGEVVKARCVNTQRTFDEAIVEQVEQSSSERVQPFCPVAASCGGCQLQHWRLEDQQQFKASHLYRSLVQWNARLQHEPALVGESQGYRHRLKLAVQWLPTVSLAMRSERSHQLVPLAACPIASPILNQWLDSLPAILEGLSGLSALTDIEIDVDTLGDVGAVCRFAKRPPESVVTSLWGALREAGLKAITLQVDADKGQWQTIFQEGHLTLQLTGLSDSLLSLVYRPGDFTQTNWQLNQKMIDQAIMWLSPANDDVVLDLFSGIGNFSLSLAQRAKQVIGIELSDAMVAAATENARTNALSNLDCHSMDLMQEELSLPKTANLALIDPPRAGAESVCKQLAKQKNIQRLVYVSCNPATLLRDADILCKAGFKPMKVSLIDMFSYTGHSEAMVLFQR